jgi:hypothetical protein
MTIVHYEHRYKRPPRKKKPAAPLEVPAVVRARRPRRVRLRHLRKSAIVTIRKPGKGYVPEEPRRRGDAAEALFREMGLGSKPRRARTMFHLPPPPVQRLSLADATNVIRRGRKLLRKGRITHQQFAVLN